MRKLAALPEALFPNVNWSPMYRILANSLPKNGTHLLLKCLGEIPGYEFSGHEIDWSDPTRALGILESVRPGEFTKGHIPCFDGSKGFRAQPRPAGFQHDS